MKRNPCLKCGKKLQGRKLRYCDGICQRQHQWLLKSNNGIIVSECCEAKVRTMLRGHYCDQCHGKTRLVVLYNLFNKNHEQ